MLHTAQIAPTDRLHVRALAEWRHVLVDPLGRAGNVTEKLAHIPVERAEQRPRRELAPSRGREGGIVRRAGRRGDRRGARIQVPHA